MVQEQNVSLIYDLPDATPQGTIRLYFDVKPQFPVLNDFAVILVVEYELTEV